MQVPTRRRLTKEQLQQLAGAEARLDQVVLRMGYLELRRRHRMQATSEGAPHPSEIDELTRHIQRLDHVRQQLFRVRDAVRQAASPEHAAAAAAELAACQAHADQLLGTPLPAPGHPSEGVERA